MEFLTLHGSSQKTDFPQLGFGTAGIGSYEKTIDVISKALDAGFRRFDTASMYDNENAIGKAVEESSINRSEIFLTTKLWNNGDFSYSSTLDEFDASLERLGVDYIDLYLHHWPAEKRLESWDAMEELVESGRTLHIGVSNYTEEHLNQLFEHGSVKPVLNQVEFNPFLYQEELLAYCQQNNVILEAHSPFAQANNMNNPTLQELSNKYHKSPAQIMLRWGIQLDISVIPKASSLDHIKQNIDIFDFEISQDDMVRISNLNENLRLEWDPTTVSV